MPSQYPSSSSSRGHRSKDKEARVHTPSTSRHRSSRRERDSHDRTEPRSPPLPSSGIYSQLNLTLDQLPALPDSVANTPSASTLYLDSTGEDTPKAEARKDPLQYQTTVEDYESEVGVGHVASSPTSPTRSTISVTQRDQTTTPNPPKGKEVDPRRNRGSSTPLAPTASVPSSAASVPHSPSVTPTGSHPPTSQLSPLTTYTSAPQPSIPPPHPPVEYTQPSETPPPTSPVFQYYEHYPPQPYYYQTSPPLPYMPMMVPPNGMSGGATDTQTMPPFSPPYSSHKSPTMEQMSSMPMNPYQPMTTRSPPYGFAEPLYGMPYQPVMEPPGIPGQRTPGDGASVRSTDDPEHLLRRVQEVLPDLSILVNRYRETHGALSTRELETRQSHEAQTTALAQKEFYLQALKDQIKEITLGHEKEKAALNLEKDNHKREINERLLEVGDLQERVRGLEDVQTKLENDKLDLIATKEGLESEKVEAAEAQKRLENEKSELLQAKETVEQEKAEMEKKIIDLEALGRRLDEDYKSHTENLEMQLQERSKERVAINQQERADLLARHEQHITDVKALHTREKDEAVERALREHESTFTSKMKELEGTISKHPLELLALRQMHEDERTSLANEHKAELERHIAEWTEKLKHKDLEFDKAKDTWLQSQEASETYHQKMKEDLVGSAGRFAQETEKMRRILEAVGEATTMKSKGDSFFVEAFQDLCQQIINLSVDYFQLLPTEPPHEALVRIPPGIPNFLDNTRASQEIRAAYVQHVVSNILTYRIFQPFLFTLGRRFGKADTLFQKMAEDMRAKSTRREAVWRQQTLKAVYTASDAKQSVNVIAALIVDDIVDQIKPFSDPRHTSAITAAVRSIVKVAAETWRYARLERELISAALPVAEDPEPLHEDWSEHEYQPYSPTTNHAIPDQGERHVLLRVLPHIVREAIHEDYPIDEDKHGAGPCVYLAGKALYSDSPPIVARKQELMQRAIDPSGITSSRPQSGIYSAHGLGSPTTASFPQGPPQPPPSPPPATSPPPPLSEMSESGPSIDGNPEPFQDQMVEGGEHNPGARNEMSQSATNESMSQSEGSYSTEESGDSRSEATATPNTGFENVLVNTGYEEGARPATGPPGGLPDWGSANP